MNFISFAFKVFFDSIKPRNLISGTPNACSIPNYTLPFEKTQICLSTMKNIVDLENLHTF